MDNRILEKIKKLLSLATSANEHEAQSASSLATALLTKYNLDMQDLDYSETDYVEEVAYTGQRVKVEHKFINGILGQHFNVKLLISATLEGSTITVLGDATNVEVALYTFNFLEITFKRLFKQFRENTGAKAGTKQSYYFGLYKGFNEQMEASRKRVEEERGLVVLPDPGVALFFKQEHPKTRNHTSKVRAGHSSAISAGTTAGRKLKVSRGISDSASTSGGLLGGR